MSYQSPSRVSPIAVEIRLRPVRFACFVEPSDWEQCLSAIRFNTSQWGGIFNPIVPIFKTTPIDWPSDPFERFSGSELIEGHLKAFEPDYCVIFREELRELVPIAQAQIIVIDQVNRTPFHGFGITSAYRHFLREDYRLSEQKPEVYFSLDSSNPDSWNEFTSEVIRIFQAKEKNFSLTTVRALFEAKAHCVLDIGMNGLRVTTSRQFSISIFLINQESPSDFIDYWNLRALGLNLLLFDPNWCEEGLDLIESCLQLSDARLLTVMAGRSVTDEQSTSFFQKIPERLRKQLSKASWPRFWNDVYRHRDKGGRCVLSAGSKTLELSNAESIKIEVLKPRFIDEHYGSVGFGEWVHVISSRSAHFQNNIALVMPHFWRSH
jgi:hypothetical protein